MSLVSPVSPVGRVPGRLLDPPLDPTPDEARGALRRELLRPEYHEEAVLQRVLTWLDRQVGRALEAASGTPPLSAFAAMLVLVLLVATLVWLASRRRLTSRRATDRAGVLTDEAVSAAALRARARQALADARYQDVVVDGFRALAVGQVERGALDDAPGTTAHEVALALAARYPDRRPEIDAGAALFDAVLYGDRPATRAQAEDVLGLDDALAALR